MCLAHALTLERGEVEKQDLRNNASSYWRSGRADPPAPASTQSHHSARQPLASMTLWLCHFRLLRLIFGPCHDFERFLGSGVSHCCDARLFQISSLSQQNAKLQKSNKKVKPQKKKALRSSMTAVSHSDVSQQEPRPMRKATVILGMHLHVRAQWSE